MNWYQFQLELNQLIHESEKRREEFEEQERERRNADLNKLVAKFHAKSLE